MISRWVTEIKWGLIKHIKSCPGAAAVLDLLAIYIWITFLCFTHTLRLGIRLFAAQSHWKFTLRRINKVLISMIVCSISPLAVWLQFNWCLISGGIGLLTHILGRLFSLAAFFMHFQDGVYWKQIYHLESCCFSASLPTSLQSLQLWSRQIAFRYKNLSVLIW